MGYVWIALSYKNFPNDNTKKIKESVFQQLSESQRTQAKKLFNNYQKKY